MVKTHSEKLGGSTAETLRHLHPLYRSFDYGFGCWEAGTAGIHKNGFLCKPTASSWRHRSSIFHRVSQQLVEGLPSFFGNAISGKGSIAARPLDKRAA